MRKTKLTKIQKVPIMQNLISKKSNKKRQIYHLQNIKSQKRDKCSLSNNKLNNLNPEIYFRINTKKDILLYLQLKLN